MNNTPFLYISNPWSVRMLRKQMNLHREIRISLYYTVLLMSMPQFIRRHMTDYVTGDTLSDSE